MTRDDSRLDVACRRVRLGVMWRVAPVSRETVDGVLTNLEGARGDGTYDSAHELRALLGLTTTAHFDTEETES